MVIEKTAFALGVGVVGIFLNAAHYIPTKNGQIVTQPDSAVSALYACYSLLPLALFACNVLCFWFYTLGARSSPPKRSEGGRAGGVRPLVQAPQPCRAASAARNGR